MKITFIINSCLLISLCSGLSLMAQQKKKTAAVLEFNSSDVSKKDLVILTNRFRSILVKTDVFDVVERERMNDILKEQNFTISDNCSSSECAAQIGKLLGVEQMVAGDVGKIASTYSVDLRLIDVMTGKIIQAETKDYKGELDGLLGTMTDIANSFASNRASPFSANKVDNPTNNCDGSYPMQKGNEVEVIAYDGRGKMTGKSIARVKERTESAGAIVATIQNDYYDAKGQLTSFETKIRCNGSKLLFETPYGLYEMPLNLNVGDELKDESSHFGNGAVTTTRHRKVEAEENVTVPAGTFKCYRIVTVSQLNMSKGANTSFSTEWFSPGIGMVKVEAYLNGKLISSQILNRITK